jgi:hypothetical protein
MNDTHHTQTLTRHRDIQKWVSTRRGLPAIRRVPDASGGIRARLAIAFEHPRPHAPRHLVPSLDDGMMPVSWTAWLAELDRQGLALKVTDEEHFEFVERSDLH